MSQSAFIVFSAALVLVAAFRPPLAAALVLLMFPLKVVAQSTGNWLRFDAIGQLYVNISVALATVLGAVCQSQRKPRPLVGLVNPASIASILIFAWSLFTLAWTPAYESALATIQTQWPYVLVALVVAPILIADHDDVEELRRWLLLVGAGVCCWMALSPEFNIKHGRLGYDFAESAKGRASALSIGEVGGLTMLAASFPGAAGSRPYISLRVVGMILGSVIAVLSGSRGQLFFAAFVLMIFYPLATPVRNLRSYGGLILLGLFAVGAGMLAASVFLNAWELNRFSLESVFYGQSSSSTRLASVINLGSMWASSPPAWIFGLGYYAYNELQTVDLYSHVLFADCLFELGLIGFSITGYLVLTVLKSAWWLGRASLAKPQARAPHAMLLALAFYYTLLANKQGFLWGAMWLFFLYSAVVRVERRERLGIGNDAAVENLQGWTPSESDEHFAQVPVAHRGEQA